MLTLCTFHRVLSSVLLLVSVSSLGESRPHEAHDGTPDLDDQRVLLVEAVKMGILNSLGMDRQPQPTRRASEQELRKMYQLYREKQIETSGNSSQLMQEIWQPSMSTVLFPAAEELMKALQREEQPGQRVQWYRAVFQKSSNINNEQRLAGAKLRISRRVLTQPSSAQPEFRQEIKVKFRRIKPANSWTHSDLLASADVSGTRDVTLLDVSPEVVKWMRADDGQALAVDVGMVVGDSDAFRAHPYISLVLDFIQPAGVTKARLPRSNKEDECNEQGWCCRKSVTVSFKEIGWDDWVVAPAEYTMYYCDGTCPHNYKPASMHTQVKSRLNQITKGGTPRPCCVPVSYEPMVLMHYDSGGKLKLTPFNDLIVTKCLCA
ncbi:bone morphogenetic protein 2-A [Aulostomus maculatus]